MDGLASLDVILNEKIISEIVISFKLSFNVYQIKKFTRNGNVGL